jgi:hypothetical protein
MTDESKLFSPVAQKSILPGGEMGTCWGLTARSLSPYRRLRVCRTSRLLDQKAWRFAGPV